MALTHRADKLKARLMEFIAENYEEVKRCENWVKAPKELTNEVLEFVMSKKNKNSELWD